MSSQNLQIAIGALRKSQRQVRTIYQQRLAALVGDTYGFLVARSPVDTGAYRASHEVYVGRERIFDPPGRPEPDERFASGTLRFSAPDARNVEAAVASAKIGGNIRFVNRRFYAKFIEFGTARIDPRRVYGNALDFARSRARALAVAIKFTSARQTSVEE